MVARALIAGVLVAVIPMAADASTSRTPWSRPAGTVAHGRPDARRPEKATRPLPADRGALESTLAPGEVVVQLAPVVGSTLVLTTERLYVLRDGARFRPKHGIVSWPLDFRLAIRIGPPSHGTRRLSIAGTGRAASVFVTTDELSATFAFAREVHLRARGLD